MMREGVLTAARWARSGVPDAGQRLIHGQHVGDRLRAVHTKAVDGDAANESRCDMSVLPGGPDAFVQNTHGEQRT